MGMRVLTKKLTAGQSFTITANYHAAMFSFQLSTGQSDAGTYIGDGVNPVDGSASEAIPIGPGGGQVFVSESADRPVTGITVTCTTGTIGINIGY